MALGKILVGGGLFIGGGATWLLSNDPQLSPVVTVVGVALGGFGMLQVRQMRRQLRSPNNPLRLARTAVTSRLQTRLSPNIPEYVLSSVASSLVSQASFFGQFAEATSPDDLVRRALLFVDHLLDTEPATIEQLIRDNTIAPRQPKDISTLRDIPVNRNSGPELLDALQDATDACADLMEAFVKDKSAAMQSDVRFAAAECVDRAWKATMYTGTTTMNLMADGFVAFEEATRQYGSNEYAIAALAASRKANHNL